MTIRDSATLKGYFNTGDIPTETNFSDMIDSMVLNQSTVVKVSPTNEYSYFFGASGNLTSTGNANTAIGWGSLVALTTGGTNVGLGVQALNANTTGNSNMAIGTNALLKNVDGSANVAIGLSALQENISGGFNIAIGGMSLDGLNTGSYNVAIGLDVLGNNTSGEKNVGIGSDSLKANTTGIRNTAVATNALYDLISGNYNTAVGYWTGAGITTGNYNTIIGAQVSGLAAGLSSTIIIADGEGLIRFYSDSTYKGKLQTAITSTKTLTLTSTGDFNLTIPATGTAALLNQANSFSLINPISTIAESWIGPSSTTGVYFKAGNIGMGEVSPGSKLQIKQDCLTTDLGAGNVQLRITGLSDPHKAFLSGFETTLNYAFLQTLNDTVSWDTYNIVIQPKGGKVGIGLNPTANMAGLSVEAGLLTLKETTTPTADADYGKIYTKSDNKLYFQDGAGTEHEIAVVA